MAYLNADGLYKKIGTEKAVVQKGGEYRNPGQFREVEIKLDLTTLNQNEVIQSDTIFIPSGVRIAEVKVVTHTAATNGVAIDLGLIRMDRTTEIDYDGLLAAFVLASMDSAGETTILTKGSATAGALIGTTTSNIGYISCSATTAAAFNAGVIYVTIKYYTP